MSKNKVAEFSKEELKALIEDKNSCVTVHKSFYNLSLYPYHLTNITTSIKDILNAGVAKYDKKLDGILLGYKNVKILTPQGAIVTDSCYIHVDIEADFYIFKPEVGATLTGIVNKRSKDHVGCLVHRIFNVSVPNKSEDDAWPGYHVEIGEEVLLQVTYINLDARLPYIRTSFIVTKSKKKKKKSKTSDEVDAAFLDNDIQEFKLNKQDINTSVTPPQSPKTKKKKKKSSDEVNDVANLLLESSTEVKVEKKKKRKSKDNNDSLTNLNIIVEEEKTNTLNASTEIKSSKKKKRKSKDNDVSENIAKDSKPIKNLTDDVLNSTSDIKSEKKRRKSKDNVSENKIDEDSKIVNDILNSTSEIKSEKKNKLKDNSVKLNSSTLEETINDVANGIFRSAMKPESDKKEKRKSKDKLNTSSSLVKINSTSTIEETINNVANGIFSSPTKPESAKREKRKSKDKLNTSTKENGIDNDLQALRNSLLAEQLANLEQLETPRNSKKRKRKSDEAMINNETPVINSEEIRKSKKRKTSFSENMSEDNLELRNSYADTSIDDSFKTPKKNKKKKHEHSFDKFQLDETGNDSIIVAKSSKKRKHSISESDGTEMMKKKRKHSETEVQNKDDSSPVKKKHKSKKNKHNDVEEDN